MNKAQRFPIDNAGQLFGSVTTARRRPRFLFIAVLTGDVNPAVLSRALEITIGRFPGFHVELKNGFFWHFLQTSDQKVRLEQEGLGPFESSDPQGPLLRIGYSGRKIILEMAHVLSDGYGGITFLKTLIIQYFILQGVNVPFTHGSLDTAETQRPEEYEDGYKKYSRRALRGIWRETGTYRLPSLSKEPGSSRKVTFLTGIMNTGDVLTKARQYRVSVTEYLAAVLIQSLCMLQKESKTEKRLPVKISVSADLRKFYSSVTLRNFSGFCNAGIDPGAGEYSFEEIVVEVHHQCRLMLSEKNLNALISRNIRDEKNILVQATPLFIKKPLAMLLLDFLASREATMDLTNMGQIELPEAIRDKVERFDTFGGNYRFFKIECGVISYQDKLCVCFSRTIDQPFVENRFFELLAAAGIRVTLE